MRRTRSRIAPVGALALVLMLVATACGDPETPATNPEAANLSQELTPGDETTDDLPGDDASGLSQSEQPRDPSGLVPAPVQPVPITGPAIPAPRAPVAVDVPAALDGVVAKAKQMLIDEFGAREPDIVVVAFEAAVWPDASLGCPQPGMEYLQVQVEGSVIELFFDGSIYTFHSDGNRVVLCP